jgi:hypothetical protein
MNAKLKELELENFKLDVFIGKWRTTGDIYGNDGEVIGRVDATDTYEWIDGKYAVMHSIESQMGEVKIHGIEMIGYDSERRAYFVSFFDNQGSVGWEELRMEGEKWIWFGKNVMGVKYHRCTGAFENKDLIIARHEHSEDNKIWKKWMDIELRRVE